MDEIITKRSGSILRVELNRPAKRNAMTSSMYVTLADVSSTRPRTTAHASCSGRGMVTVAESGSGPYSQLVHAGRHVLSADEPQASGGHDVGPSHYWPDSAPAPP
jgi:hypothetical protein